MRLLPGEKGRRCMTDDVSLKLEEVRLDALELAKYSDGSLRPLRTNTMVSDVNVAIKVRARVRVWCGVLTSSKLR